MDTALLDVRGLAAHDFVRVPYPSALAACVKRAQGAWEAFCGLPDEEKRRFGYQPDTLLSGVGYQPPESGCDPKEHFHVRLSERQWLLIECLRVNLPEATAFVEAALTLCEEAKPFAREFVETAEEEFSIPHLLDDTWKLRDQWTLRFLHYMGGCEPGQAIAAQHLDKGAFTAHLYESDEGFERFTRDERWEPVPFGDGHTAIIAGFRLQYRSRCKLTAVCHRVVATERTARHGRYSIVLFFDCVNTPYYNKQKLGPMQQYPAGFNYGIPFPALATYFTEQT